MCQSHVYCLGILDLLSMSQFSPSLVSPRVCSKRGQNPINIVQFLANSIFSLCLPLLALSNVPESRSGVSILE